MEYKEEQVLRVFKVFVLATSAMEDFEMSPETVMRYAFMDLEGKSEDIELLAKMFGTHGEACTMLAQATEQLINKLEDKIPAQDPNVVASLEAIFKRS